MRMLSPFITPLDLNLDLNLSLPTFRSDIKCFMTQLVPTKARLRSRLRRGM